MSNAETLKYSAKVLTTSILPVPSFSMRRKFLTLYPIASAKHSWVRWCSALRCLMDFPIKRESIFVLTVLPPWFLMKSNDHLTIIFFLKIFKSFRSVTTNNASMYNYIKKVPLIQEIAKEKRRYFNNVITFVLFLF